MGGGQGEVRKRFEREPVVRAALIIPCGREHRWREVIDQKNNDREGPLHDPVHIEQPAEPEKNQHTKKSEQAVAEFFTHGKHLRPTRSVGNMNLRFALWCNGNTVPFGGIIHGSSPCGAANTGAQSGLELGGYGG